MQKIDGHAPLEAVGRNVSALLPAARTGCNDPVVGHGFNRRGYMPPPSCIFRIFSPLLVAFLHCVADSRLVGIVVNPITEFADTVVGPRFLTTSYSDIRVNIAARHETIIQAKLLICKNILRQHETC